MKKTLIIALLALMAMAGQAKVKTVVWENPAADENTKIEGFIGTLLEINRVEFAEDETRVFMRIARRPEKWVRLATTTHLVADGKEFALKHLDGMELDKETFLTEHGYADVVFHFEPLPLKTQRFDFTEGDLKGAWKILGVEDVKTKAQHLFPSNWRNTQTGDWDISFFDECAIYDCQFWNYKQKQQNGDKYAIVLENGGKEIVVNVDKNKDGVRNITIDGQKGKYNLISSVAMPDYPQKDTRTDFRDTHYQTDTVTFIGWLKDMPESMKKQGNEYRLTVYDKIFDDHNENIRYGKMDSLGRFVIKVPMLNAAEVFLDRTSISTLFEPGETYLMLYDFKGGHKMFMGKDCRLQNEMLAHPIQWGGRYPREENMDKAKALEFMQGVKDDKAKALQELETVIAANPNVSDRYINYLKGHYEMDECHSLMRSRYYMKDWKIPAEIMGYVNQHWQQLRRPYTLYGDFGMFRRDYIDNLIADRYISEGGMVRTPLLYPVILRKYRDKGKVKITDEELDIVQRYVEGFCKYSSYRADDEEAKKALDTFFKSDLVKQFSAIYDREDVEKAIQEEYPLSFVYFSLCVLDSIGSDQDMRDIIIVNGLQKLIDQRREALSDHIMQFLEENVKMPAAKAYVKARNEKYLALQRRDISKSPCLKSAEDVANMSDGEKILRKLIEPYKGKTVLLDIWGTWCSPCKEGLKHSQEEYKRLKDYDIVYLYLANGSPEEAWKNVIKEYEVLGDNVVHYNLPQDQQQAVENFVGISGYPTYRLIDGDGNVLDVNADPRFDLDGLAKLLDKMNARKD